MSLLRNGGRGGLWKCPPSEHVKAVGGCRPGPEKAHQEAVTPPGKLRLSSDAGNRCQTESLTLGV